MSEEVKKDRKKTSVKRPVPADFAIQVATGQPTHALQKMYNADFYTVQGWRGAQKEEIEAQRVRLVDEARAIILGGAVEATEQVRLMVTAGACSKCKRAKTTDANLISAAKLFLDRIVPTLQRTEVAAEVKPVPGDVEPIEALEADTLKTAADILEQRGLIELARQVRGAT
jgi:hypothetical protein